MGWGPIVTQMSGGPKFRKYRKITQETMSARHMNEYVSLQKQATYTFLTDIGDAPGTSFTDHIKRWEFRQHDLVQPSHLLA